MLLAGLHTLRWNRPQRRLQIGLLLQRAPNLSGTRRRQDRNASARAAMRSLSSTVRLGVREQEMWHRWAVLGYGVLFRIGTMRMA